MPKAPKPKPKKNSWNSAGVLRAISIQVTANHFSGPFIFMRINAKQRPITTPKNIAKEAISRVTKPAWIRSGRLFKTGRQWKL